MIRLASIIWLTLALAMVFIVFQVKYAVQEIEDELASVNHDIVAEQERIHVLRAEWSYLNNPKRLSTLARTVLEMQPVDEAREVRPASLPWAPEDMGHADVASGPPAPPAPKPTFVSTGATQ